MAEQEEKAEEWNPVPLAAETRCEEHQSGGEPCYCTVCGKPLRGRGVMTSCNCRHNDIVAQPYDLAWLMGLGLGRSRD